MPVGPLAKRLCGAIAALALSSAIASAQTWPDRPIKLMIAFGSGGTIDTLGRILADKLSDRWKQGVVVENKPGGGGNIGAAAAAATAPDGYSIHLGAQSLATNVTLLPAPNFDPVRDLEPVYFIGYATDVMMVPKDSPFKTLADVIAEGKAKPGSLNYASTGIGSSGHLATVLFSQMAGVKAQHVPYTSLGAAMTDLTGGRLSFWISTLGSNLGNVQAGSVRALGISGAQRAKDIPDVPTFKEQGVALVEPSTWFGIFVPKKTPPDVIAKINRDFAAILAEPALKERLSTLGFTLVGGEPKALADHLAADIAKWAKVASSPEFAVK
jgi:tripartite-type tricarboxylate transporter receptor subunit TctC